VDLRRSFPNTCLQPKKKRVEDFAQAIAADLTTLQDRVDEQAILTDEFAFVVEECFRGVVEHYQQEKLESFRGILVNSATGLEPSQDEREFFLSLVDRLSVLHIRILRFMAFPEDYLKHTGIQEDSIRGGFSYFFPIAIPGVGIEAIKSVFQDLHQSGLQNTGVSIFGTMTSGEGLELLANRVTDLGIEFVEFCTPPQ
jgi:hypothetical protein